MKANKIAGLLFSAIGLFTLLSFVRLQQTKKQIVCFGDSITYGATVDGHSWVWYLQQQKQSSFEYINAGRSGRKTADQKELPPVLDKYPHASMYVFFLGVNDLKDGSDSMVNASIANMAWMIDQVHQKAPGADVLLLAPADINTQEMSEVNKKKLYNENTRASLKKLAVGYKKLAAEKGAAYLSLLKVVPKHAYSDGLHPNAEGQKALFEAIDKKIDHYYAKSK